MAAIHTSGSIACFLFGGLIILFAIFGYTVSGVGVFDPKGLVLIGGIGAGLIALGWYIGVLSKN